jgi:hypothetical protein
MRWYSSLLSLFKITKKRPLWLKAFFNFKGLENKFGKYVILRDAAALILKKFKKCIRGRAQRQNVPRH